MKRFLCTITSAAIVASIALAGPVMPVKSTISNASTNVATTNAIAVSLPYGGFLEGIYVDLGAGATNVTLTFYALSDAASAPQRTLLTLTALLVDGYFPVRIPVCGVVGTTTVFTNDVAQIPLFQGGLRMVLTDPGYTNVSLDAYLYIAK